MQKMTVEIDAPVEHSAKLFDFIQQKFSESEDFLFDNDEDGMGFQCSHSVDGKGNEFDSLRFMTTNKEKWIKFVNENQYNGSGRHWSGNGVKVSKLTEYSLKNLINASIMVNEEVVN